MPIFDIKTNQKLIVDGEYIDKGLSVQISVFTNNPFHSMNKINETFKRIYGIDFKKNGFLSPGFFEYEKK